MLAVTQNIGFMAGMPPYETYYSRVVSVWANSGASTPGVPEEVSTDTGRSTWPNYFSEYSATGLFQYTYGTGVKDTGTLGTKTIALNRLGRFFLTVANSNWSSDVATANFEFLDASDNVVVALKITKPGDYLSKLEYGANLSSLTEAPVVGNYNVNGDIYLESGQLRFVRYADVSSRYGNFTFACDALSIKKVRVSNARAYSTYTGSSATAMVRLFHMPIP